MWCLSILIIVDCSILKLVINPLLKGKIGAYLLSKLFYVILYVNKAIFYSNLTFFII